MEFNEKLLELRKQKGLTQEQLASALYVSRTAISKWESGRGYPNIDSLRAIAKFFGITIDELLSADEVIDIASEQNKATRTRFRDIIFGLLDICFALLLFLPLFATREGDAVVSASLLTLGGLEPYLKIALFVLVFAPIVMGVLILALQGCVADTWAKSRYWISLSLSLAALLLFVLSLQPYAAVFALAMAVIKVLVLINR